MRPGLGSAPGGTCALAQGREVCRFLDPGIWPSSPRLCRVAPPFMRAMRPRWPVEYDPAPRPRFLTLFLVEPPSPPLLVLGPIKEAVQLGVRDSNKPY